MFSFEGHYKKPRSINYSKQKDVGKKDLIENARSEREKRALLNRQIICATRIQKAYRHYLIIKRNKKQAFNEFRHLMSEISQFNLNEVQFNVSIVKAIDYLLMFFDSSNLADDSLKLIVNLLVVNDKIGGLFANISIQNYYYAVTLNLFLRIIAKHLRSFPENSQSISYNLFIRFFEIFFSHLHNLSINNTLDRNIHNRFYDNVLHFLLQSKYFSDISVFIDRQFLFRCEDSYEVYNQLKVNSILKIVLKPIETAKIYDLLHVAVIRFVNNIYSKQKIHSINPLKILKLMNIAILDIVSLNVFIDIIYQHFNYPNGTNSINISSELLLLILSSVVDVKIDCLTPEISAKTLLLFFHISRSLFDENQLVLTNNLPEHINTDTNLINRDDFDFEMKVIERDDDESDDDEDDDDEKSGEHQAILAVPMEMSLVEQEIAVILKMKFCQIIVPQAIQAEHLAIDMKLLYDSIGYVYHLLILETKLIGSSESKTFILNLIQMSKTVSRRLWRSVVEQKTKDANESLMKSLINGQLRSVDNDVKEFFGKLLCFANCLHWRLLSVQDLDLIKIDSEDSSKVMEFSPNELCEIVLKLRDIMCGLILLIYESRSGSSSSSITQDKRHLKPVKSQICNEKLVKMFIELQRVVIRLYNRDVRKGLQVSGKRLEWVKSEICRINVNQLNNFRDLLLKDYRFDSRNFGQLSSTDFRQLVILKEMPFIVPIGTRMKLFKELINSIHTPTSFNMRSPIRVRRDNLYEDAFNQITKKSFANLRSNLKIEFVDRFGMIESGVDGGGLLREFLTNIIKEACDPKRGLFVSTKNNLLYPNPELETLYPENWRSHLDFFGRMLGLIIFKGLLVEAPFAPFFIQKLFNNRSSREEIDIDNLQYLDEDLYRNLLSLKSMTNVEDINLDFTVSRSCYGMTKIVELKPNGEHISVTNSNKIEYIYLVADYKLNRQISSQTSVIIAGLDDVFPIECFQLFDLDEISFIITGGGSSIDLCDLKRNTIYHGIDDPENSDTIKNFWIVLFDMSEDEKRNFIQFVTSISRPPMLGFSELTPKFAIQVVQDTDRLPTASTCINLLRLPAYEKLEEMRQKLLYAIGSDSGFHLS